MGRRRGRCCAPRFQPTTGGSPPYDTRGVPSSGCYHPTRCFASRALPKRDYDYPSMESGSGLANLKPSLDPLGLGSGCLRQEPVSKSGEERLSHPSISYMHLCAVPDIGLQHNRASDSCGMVGGSRVFTVLSSCLLLYRSQNSSVRRISSFTDSINRRLRLFFRALRGLRWYSIPLQNSSKTCRMSKYNEPKLGWTSWR